MADRTDPAHCEDESDATLCDACGATGYHPDDIDNGICVECAKAPAACKGCGRETTRGELDADELCTECEMPDRSQWKEVA